MSKKIGSYKGGGIYFDYDVEVNKLADKTPNQKCEICQTPLWMRWTIFSGMAVCTTCNAPYTVYHFKGNKLVSRKPVCDVPKKFIPALREAWKQSGGDLEKFAKLAKEIVKEDVEEE